MCIDPEIVNGGQLAEESLLLQRLESFGARHKIESQLIPASVTWKRAVVEHDVADSLQVKLIKHTLVSSSTNYHKFSFFPFSFFSLLDTKIVCYPGKNQHSV